jgi:hypothetical protein
MTVLIKSNNIPEHKMENQSHYQEICYQDQTELDKVKKDTSTYQIVSITVINTKILINLTYNMKKKCIQKVPSMKMILNLQTAIEP